MATSSVLISTKQTTNYARLCRLQVDGASHVLRERFDNIYPPATLPKVLSSPAVHTVLQNLRKRKILNPQQWGKLFPVSKSTVSSNSFDITLLVVLLRNICGLTAPPTGWDCMPSPADTTPEADIARIKYYRNHLYGHASEAKISDGDFKKYWKEIRDVLLRLGGKKWEKDIDELETEVMDPDIEEHYIELLKDWYKDDHSILDKLDQVEKHQRQKLEDIEAEQNQMSVKFDYLLQKQNEILGKVEQSFTTKENKSEVTDLDDIHWRMTASLQQFYRDEFSTIQPLSWCEDRFDMDATYTDIVIKERKNKKYSDEVSINSMISNFASNAPGKPKPLLIEGDPGMGKTTLCQKLCYDWATKSDNVLKHFDLVLFVECCKLSSSLKDTVFEQIFPEDFPISRDTMWRYIKEKEAKILFVVDGYDELSSAEPQSDIVRLIHGKILRDSCVLVTSRLDRSDSIRLACKQAKCFKILGFSQNSTYNYAKRYFSNDKRKGELFSVEINKNENFLKEGCVTPLHVTLHCLLWDDEEESPPSTVTELYYRMLVLMICLYCKKHGISADGEKIPNVLQPDLLRLGKIAFEGIESNRVYFDEAELLNQMQDHRVLRFGFLTKVKSRLSCTSYYTFTHKSFQEFIGAYYLASEIKKSHGIPEENLRIVDLPLLCSFLVGFLQGESEPVFNLFRVNTVIEADGVNFKNLDGAFFFPFPFFPFAKTTSQSSSEWCSIMGNLMPESIYSREDKLIQMFQMLSECTEDHESIIHTCAMVLPSTLNLAPLYFGNARFAASVLKLIGVPGNPVQTIIYHFSQPFCAVLPFRTLLTALSYNTCIKVVHFELETEYILHNSYICECLSKFLKRNSTVSELHLYIRNGLPVLYSDFPPFQQVKDAEIKAVWLCIEAITYALRTNMTLQKLCLSGCLVDEECLQTLLEGMKLNDSLTGLVIRCVNNAGFAGWKALHEILTVSKSLKFVAVGGTSWERKRSHADVNEEQDALGAISLALKQNCSLTKLLVECTDFDQLQLCKLFESLETNTNLHSLSLGQFSDVKREVFWFKTIFDGVRRSTTIYELDISAYVELGSVFLGGWSRYFLSSASSVTFWAELTRECLLEVEIFISKNKTLESLVMRNYRFPAVDDIVMCTSPGLRNNAIRFLDLDSCCDKNGGEFLVRWAMALVRDGPMEHLVLTCCQLSDKHMQYIANCIKAWNTIGCSLTFLDLSHNCVSSAGFGCLAAELNGSSLSEQLKICLDYNCCDNDLQLAVDGLSGWLKSSFVFSSQ